MTLSWYLREVGTLQIVISYTAVILTTGLGELYLSVTLLPQEPGAAVAVTVGMLLITVALTLPAVFAVDDAYRRKFPVR